MEYHLNNNNKFLIERFNLFLIKEYAINKSFFYKIKKEQEISREYYSLLRLSYILGEPFDGNFGFRKVVINLFS